MEEKRSDEEVVKEKKDDAESLARLAETQIELVADVVGRNIKAAQDLGGTSPGH